MFEVGDIVTCIDDGKYPDLEVGKSYVVLSTDYKTKCIGVLPNRDAEYFEYRFKLESPAMMNSDEYDEAISAQDAYEKAKASA